VLSKQGEVSSHDCRSVAAAPSPAAPGAVKKSNLGSENVRLLLRAVLVGSDLTVPRPVGSGARPIFIAFLSPWVAEDRVTVRARIPDHQRVTARLSWNSRY
ncbi:MAG: hypothetical protein L0338_24940, partial [Acidobacteria bacterium]|nr:hypothetical protein [Acidobacteriota bacterium]